MDDLLQIGVSNAVAASLLAGVAILAGLVYKRPALVHGLWLLVLLKLVTPPLVRIPIALPSADISEPVNPPDPDPVPVPVPVFPRDRDRESVINAVYPLDRSAEAPSLPTDTADAVPISASQPPSWTRTASFAWLTGSLLWFALAGWRLRRFRNLLRFSCPAPVEIQERARQLAGRLGLTRCPRVDLLPGRIAPLLWAVGKPRLLLPTDLLARLSEEQLDTLFVHELAHLRRRDPWVRVLEFVVLGLYWWHPVVWYARRELREAEEQCCDAWVVSMLPGAGRTYANALMDTLDFLSPTPPAPPLLASGLGQMADLKRRLTMILRGTTPRALSWPGCLAVIALGALCLPMLPGLRGDPPGREGEAKFIDKELEAAQAKRQQAEADFRRAEALLKLKKAKLEQAKAAEKKAKAEGGNKKVYQIVITLTTNQDVNCQELVKKLGKLLPENVHGEFASSGPYTNPPRQHMLYPIPAPPESRINALERKLEAVLRELQEMRKQMPSYRGPAGRGGVVPVPGNRGALPFVPAPRHAPPGAGTPPAAPGRVQPAPGTPAAPRAIPAPVKPVPPPAAPPPVGEDPYNAPTVPLAPDKPQRR